MSFKFGRLPFDVLGRSSMVDGMSIGYSHDGIGLAKMRKIIVVGR